MKKVLLTGASGFIGRNLTEAYAGKYELFTPSHTELDLLDTDAVRAYLSLHQFDVVLHTANRNTSKESSTISPYDSLDGNLRMFFNLERCHDLYGKMLYYGSGAEYDRTHMSPSVKEEEFGTFLPTDPYGFSKYIMAKACEASENIYDLCLFGVYGKYEEWEHRFISNAICRVIKGLPITISQNVFFDYLYIDDLAKITEWFIENTPKYHRYNVCSGDRIDLLSLAKLVKEITESTNEIKVAQPGLKKEYTGNNGRMRKEVHQLNLFSRKESIRELYKYYLSSKEKCTIFS